MFNKVKCELMSAFHVVVSVLVESQRRGKSSATYLRYTVDTYLTLMVVWFKHKERTSQESFI